MSRYIVAEYQTSTRRQRFIVEAGTGKEAIENYRKHPTTSDAVKWKDDVKLALHGPFDTQEELDKFLAAGGYTDEIIISVTG